MKTLFVRKNKMHSNKNDKDYYTCTYLIGNSMGTSFIDKEVYDWLDVCECGDEIPDEFISVDLYERNNELKADVKFDINKKIK